MKQGTWTNGRADAGAPGPSKVMSEAGLPPGVLSVMRVRMGAPKVAPPSVESSTCISAFMFSVSW